MDDNQASAANRYSLSAQVRDAIEGKIATGELAPGDRIVEARIAAELHVSSIPVREAIRELVAKRVLEAMSDQQYRRWANGIITAIAGYYVIHGTVLVVLAHAYAR